MNVPEKGEAIMMIKFLGSKASKGNWSPTKSKKTAEPIPWPPVRVSAPGYERDPFELSIEELQRLLDRAPRPGSGPRKSPFKD